jgi:hypothetical protein
MVSGLEIVYTDNIKLYRLLRSNTYPAFLKTKSTEKDEKKTRRKYLFWESDIQIFVIDTHLAIILTYSLALIHILSFSRPAGPS